MASKLEIIETLSLPGSPGKANEDRLGHRAHMAFAIDGATGLGGRSYMDSHGSDAAWLAAFAAEMFLAQSDNPDVSVKSIIAQLNRSARASFFEVASGEAIARYAWPSAGFAMIRVIGDRLEFSGLGDCKALLLRRDGAVEIHSALGDFFTAEGAAAATHLSRLGGFSGGNLLGDANTLAGLRSAREKQNTPDSGIWTLGMVEEAAEHVKTINLAASDYTLTLICTDGFSSLIDAYRTLTPKELMRAATRDGLAFLGDQIRRIERETDPDGTRFPRFKQSDDASALLAKITS